MEVAAWDTLLGLGLLAAAVTMLFRRRGLTGTELRHRLRALQNQHRRRPRLAEAAETSAAPQVTATAKRLYQILQSDFQDARSMTAASDNLPNELTHQTEEHSGAR